MSVTIRISSASDVLDSDADTANPIVSEITSRKVKYNEDLNGYHFPYFNEHFICREELPRGSSTFQRVLDEITDEVDNLDVSDQPQRLAVNNRRKSVSTMSRTAAGKDQTLLRVNTSERRRKISWGKPSFIRSETSMTPSYTRPRVCSDGAVVRRGSVSLRPRKS